ncbi:MAG TPA: COX15/CtaA family protein [Bryobacteraceae bacterium]|jgi:cytochrome c oxidase assembly protein subunit 15|nr:COX15/CtaA family protein [Bryobacteraceae bacterium]
MDNIRLHRFAVVLAFCTLFLVVAGGLVTSNDAGLSVPDWPLSYGKVMPVMEGGIFYEHGHRMVATTVGFLTIVLTVWLWRAERRTWLKRLGLAALGAVVAQGVLGGLTVIFLLPKPVSIAHACLAELFFSTTVAIALFTSPAWRKGPLPVDDGGGPSLHLLAVGTAAVVLTQVALGAAARHQALHIIPHIAGALAVTVMVLWVTLRVLVRHMGHAPLRRSALTLLSLACCQVFLGIAAYMSRIATADAPQPMPVMVGFTVAHVAVGALTMAASVILAIQVFRHVRPATGDLAVGGVTVTS